MRYKKTTKDLQKRVKVNIIILYLLILTAMYRKIFSTTYAYTLRKIFGVTLIVFLALTVKVDFIGETDEVVQFDYLAAKEIHGTASLEFCQTYQKGKDIENPLHILLEELCESEEEQIDHYEDILPIRDFTFLCDQSSLLCKKTLFNGSFSQQEKADYFGQVGTLVNDMDRITKRGAKLVEVFTQILINQIKGNRRGSSTWTKLTMNLGGLKYKNEFFQVLTHEVGHIMDLGALQGKSKTKHQFFTEFGKAVFAVDDPSLEYYQYSRQSETIRKS